MAIAGTLVYTWFMQDPATRGLHAAIDISAFYIPYVYYVPDMIGSAIFFSIWLLLIDALLFLLSLFVVPVIVLEKKGLTAAFAGSIALAKRTWGEITGCYLIFVLIAIGISFISVIICLTPVFVNHDYDFFLSWYRGRVLMTAICFLYIAGWWVLMAIGSTIAGIAIASLYTYGKTGQTPGEFTES